VDTPIAADSKLNDVLARYPSAGPIFFQAGRAFVAKPRDLYAQYPGLTIGEYARLNGLDTATLVSRVRAEAESAEAQRRLPAPDDDAPSRRRTALTLGYTSSYRAGEDSGQGARSVVSVQSAHGPE
jgi:hypothetical protein